MTNNRPPHASSRIRQRIAGAFALCEKTPRGEAVDLLLGRSPLGVFSQSTTNVA